MEKLTISILKSGACPVMPNTVVLRYFSWPARSIKVTTYNMNNQLASTLSQSPCDYITTFKCYHKSHFLTYI